MIITRPQSEVSWADNLYGYEITKQAEILMFLKTTII